MGDQSGKKVIGKLSNAVIRVLRFAKQIAFKGLIIFERAGIAMSEGFSLLFNHLVPGSNKAIAMKRQLDMDYFVLVDNMTPPQQITQFINELRIKVQGFKFSIVVFNLIIKVFDIIKKC